MHKTVREGISNNLFNVDFTYIVIGEDNLWKKKINKKVVETPFETPDGVLSDFTYGDPVITIVKNSTNIIGDIRNKRLLKKYFIF